MKAERSKSRGTKRVRDRVQKNRGREREDKDEVKDESGN
jgi:hypothetical protein